MATKEYVENKLNFLITEYNFTFEYNDTQGEHFIYKNKYGCIEFYSWAQFDETAIYVACDLVSKKINLHDEYPQVLDEYSDNHKGIKWIFKDKMVDYWKMIASIVQMEIKNKNSIFGLKIN